MVRKRLRIKKKTFVKDVKPGPGVKLKRVTRKSYTIKDRGALGRGPKIIPKLKKGTLGGPGFFKKSTEARRKFEVSLAKKIGEKKVQGKLQAVATLNKRINPSVSKKAAADRRFIAASFIGKKRVPTGEGLVRKR